MNNHSKLAVCCTALILLLLASMLYGAGVHPLLHAARDRIRMNVDTLTQINSLSTSSEPICLPTPLEMLESVLAIDVEGDNAVLDCFVVTDGNGSVLHEIGARIGSRVGNIWTVSLTLDQLDSLCGRSDIVSVTPSFVCAPCLDSSRRSIGADLIQETYGYDGTGVVVGIVDNAIDPYNRDFLDDNDSTRVLWIWDQYHPDSSSEYGYGKEYSKNEIDLGLYPSSTETWNHGTHVAGIACGSGMNTYRGIPESTYVGVAPGTDIISVRAVMATKTFQTKVTDAVMYVAERATEEGKPWVANLSLGSDWGPRDGTSPFEQILYAITNQSILGQGRLIVCAAGNDNYVPGTSPPEVCNHSRKSGTADVFLEVGSYALSNNDWVWIQIWYPGDQDYTVTVESPIIGHEYGPFPPDSGTSSPGYGWLWSSNPDSSDGFVLVHNSHYAGTGPWVNAYPYTDDREILIGLSDLEFQGSWHQLRDGYWKVTLSGGSGEWDLYITGQNTYMETMVEEDDYNNDFKVSEPGNAFNIITVGSYTSKVAWFDIDSVFRYGDGLVAQDLGTETWFSSRGPTRDWRPKPDVLAPGAAVVSSINQEFYWNSTSGFLRTSLAADSAHYAALGTSMATPHISGLIALMLQKNPDITHADVINCITSTSDDLKVDAYEALRCVQDDIDEITEEDETTPATFFLPKCYPNPFNNSTLVEFEVVEAEGSDSQNRVRLEIFNILGQRIRILKDGYLGPGKHAAAWDGRDENGKMISSGVYFCRVLDNGRQSVAKMICVK